MILQLLNKTIGYTTKHTLIIDSKKEELFRLCNLQPFQGGQPNNNQHYNQEQFYNYIYTNVYNILKKQPELVHTTWIDNRNNTTTTGSSTKNNNNNNHTGYNLLHCICTNLFLVNHIQLIQLILYTSEYVTVINSVGTTTTTTTTKARSTTKTTTATSIGPTITTYLLSKMMNSPFSIQLQQHQQQQSSTLFQSETKLTSASSSTSKTTKTTSIVHVLKDNSIIVPSSARIVRDVTLVHGMNCLHLLLLSNLSLVHITTIQFILQSYPECVYKYDYINSNLPIHTACNSIYQYCTTKVTTDTNTTSTKSLLDVIQILLEQYPDSCCQQNKDGNVPLHLLVALCTDTSTVTSTSNVTGSTTNKQCNKSLLKVKTIIEEQEDNTSTTLDDTQSSSFDIDDFDLYNTNTNTIELDCTDPYMLEFLNESSSYDNTDDDSCCRNNDNNNNNTIDLSTIIQYVIDINPTALLICNNNGYTPYELALVQYNNYINNNCTCSTDNNNNNNNIDHILQIVQLLASATTKAKSTATNNDDNNNNNNSSSTNNNKRAIRQRNINDNNYKNTSDNQHLQHDIDVSIHFTKTHSIRMENNTENLYQESFLSDCWTSNTMNSSHHNQHFQIQNLNGKYQYNTDTHNNDDDVLSMDNLFDVASQPHNTNNNNNNYDWNVDALHARLATWNKENTSSTKTRVVEASGDDVQCTTTSCNQRSSIVQNQLEFSSDDDDESDADEEEENLEIL